jgi:hypothetical protein
MKFFSLISLAIAVRPTIKELEEIAIATNMGTILVPEATAVTSLIGKESTFKILELKNLFVDVSPQIFVKTYPAPFISAVDSSGQKISFFPKLKDAAVVKTLKEIPSAIKPKSPDVKIENFEFRVAKDLGDLGHLKDFKHVLSGEAWSKYGVYLDKLQDFKFKIPFDMSNWKVGQRTALKSTEYVVVEHVPIPVRKATIPRH